MTIFTRTWNTAYESSPPDSQSASQGASRIREVKVDVGERLGVDHSWAGDADDGAHKKLTLVEQGSDPSAVADRMFLYTKEGTDGKSELYIRDEDGDIIQITSNGSFGMVGEIKCFAFSSVPTGWFECDGSAVSRTTYADLFAKIGTTFGNGDGSTTFNLPDLRGEFIRGYDNGRGKDSGRTFGSLQSDQNKQHNHTGSTSTDGDHTHSTNVYATGAGSFGNNADGANGASNIPTNTVGDHSHTFTTDNDGGTESRPTNVAMLYCIKY